MIRAALPLLLLFILGTTSIAGCTGPEGEASWVWNSPARVGMVAHYRMDDSAWMNVSVGEPITAWLTEDGPRLFVPVTFHRMPDAGETVLSEYRLAALVDQRTGTTASVLLDCRGQQADDGRRLCGDAPFTAARNTMKGFPFLFGLDILLGRALTGGEASHRVGNEWFEATLRATLIQEDPEGALLEIRLDGASAEAPFIPEMMGQTVEVRVVHGTPVPTVIRSRDRVWTLKGFEPGTGPPLVRSDERLGPLRSACGPCVSSHGFTYGRQGPVLIDFPEFMEKALRDDRELAARWRAGAYQISRASYVEECHESDVPALQPSCEERVGLWGIEIFARDVSKSDGWSTYYQVNIRHSIQLMEPTRVEGLGQVGPLPDGSMQPARDLSDDAAIDAPTAEKAAYGLLKAAGLERNFTWWEWRIPHFGQTGYEEGPGDFHVFVFGWVTDAIQKANGNVYANIQVAAADGQMTELDLSHGEFLAIWGFDPGTLDYV